MINRDLFGAVYTPIELSDFVSQLAVKEYLKSKLPQQNTVVLDPACGEGILLNSLGRLLSNKNGIKYVGIDIDTQVIKKNKKDISIKEHTYICQNSILPSIATKADLYWRNKLKSISIIIANPPWSSEKLFDEKTLNEAGYNFIVGQYDCYVLFLELCLKIIDEQGIIAFIVPDSLFSGENGNLRKYLCKNTEIKVIARLGEKIFPNINRATSILILRKCKPSNQTQTKCYRLNTADRKLFINGELKLSDTFYAKQHRILQKRFLHNANCIFDIDTLQEEETILNKIEKDRLKWENVFQFSRGVEISKTGEIVICSLCKKAQGYSKKQFLVGKKTCQHCKKEIYFNKSQLECMISDHKKKHYIPIYVGENIKRYTFDGIKYICPNVEGINYKDSSLYTPPKILIRKTGLGIYACIDDNSTYINQTVYSCNLRSGRQDIPLEYYLGILNSRLIYYYYLKKYGENEWKSHPYLTKDIIFSLPIKSVSADNRKMCLSIARNVKRLQICYDQKVDMKIEAMVMKLYGISKADYEFIHSELNRLPNLNAINNMKIADSKLCLDI
jgi:hypothetical protein